jgi:hypothetical protein
MALTGNYDTSGVYYQGVVQQIHRLLSSIVDGARKAKWQQVQHQIVQEFEKVKATSSTLQLFKVDTHSERLIGSLNLLPSAPSPSSPSSLNLPLTQRVTPVDPPTQSTRFNGSYPPPTHLQPTSNPPLLYSFFDKRATLPSNLFKAHPAYLTKSQVETRHCGRAAVLVTGHPRYPGTRMSGHLCPRPSKSKFYSQRS